MTTTKAPVREPLLAHRGTGRFYRPELDILRFGAFLLVYESHALPLRAHASRLLVAVRLSGALGVPLFFLLSAYLITELLLKEKARTNTVDIKAFYLRRILRIWPLYFAAIFIGFGLSHLLPVMPMSLAALAAYLLLVGNLWTVMHIFLPLGIGSLWSICLEEQFYLLWPSLARLCSVRVMAAICVIIWLFSQGALLALCATHASISPTIWTNSVTHFQFFALGGLLSILLNGNVPQWPAWIRIVAALTGLGLLFVANSVFNTYLYDETSSIRHTYFGYLITGPAVILLLLSALGTTPSRIMSPAIWMGKLSYGLYVFHLPILLLMLAVAHRVQRPGSHPTLYTIGAGIPLTILISFLSYRYFESPFLRIKERFAVVKSRAV